LNKKARYGIIIIADGRELIKYVLEVFSMEKIFRDLYDVIQSGVSKKYYALAYFPEEKKVERVGISLKDGNKLSVEHLEHDNFTVSCYDICKNLDEKMKVFVHDAYPYWKIAFLPDCHKCTVFLPKTNEVFEATLILFRIGEVVTSFGFDTETGHKGFKREDYEREFVILEK